MRYTHLGTTALAVLSAACAGDDGRKASSPGILDVQVAERATLRRVALDTLSDSTRILALSPEPDGDAVAFTFADPARRVTSGLAILDRARPAPQLAWPDSVTGVRWRGPHELAFSSGTGTGVFVVVNAHTDTISAIREASDTFRVSAPTVTNIPNVIRARAAQFIDSLHVQPEGRPQHSALRYAPSTIILARHDSVAAVHVAGIDSAGRRFNPAWYVLDLRSQHAHPVDTLIGPISLMPPEAGAWTDEGTFLFAKGLVLHEARVRRRTP